MKVPEIGARLVLQRHSQEDSAVKKSGSQCTGACAGPCDQRKDFCFTQGQKTTGNFKDENDVLGLPWWSSGSWLQDSPGGSVDKKPPASTGDTGLIPGLGRSPVPQPSPRALELVLRSKSSHHDEKQLESSPTYHNQRKTVGLKEDPEQPK